MVVNQGYLRKKSPKSFMGMSAWQERFFVLEREPAPPRLLYYKSDRARNMAEQPNGVIMVRDIRCVTMPQDHRDGCRFDIETSSRRVYELQAGSAAECQRWITVLTRECRSAGTLADLSDEKAMDEAHERDMALMLMQNQGGASGDGSNSTTAPLLLSEPDYTDDDLVGVKGEIIREMDQFSLSVSIDLHGYNADKISPFVVLFAQEEECSSAAASTSYFNTAAASSDGVAAQAAPPTFSPSAFSLYDHIDCILNDPGHEKGLYETAASLRILPTLLLYYEIRNFKQCTTAAAQYKASTNIWQRFLRKGAADYVHFPTSTDMEQIAQPPLCSPTALISPTPSSASSAILAPSPVSPSPSPSSPSPAPSAPLSLVDRVHECLKNRAITLTTFDGLLEYIFHHTLSKELWSEYVKRVPAALNGIPMMQANCPSPNSSNIHPTQRKITGSATSATGVQVARSAQWSIVNANTLRGWQEVCRTEVLPRLGKKSFQVSPHSSSSPSPSDAPANQNHRAHAKASLMSGELAARMLERRHFEVMTCVNLDPAATKTVERRICKLNGVDSVADLRRPSVRQPMGRQRRSASCASALNRPPANTAADSKTLSTSPIASSTLAAVIPSEEEEEEEEDEEDEPDANTDKDDDDDETGNAKRKVPEANASALAAFTAAATSPSTSATSTSRVNVNPNLKSLRFHLYHSTDNSDDLCSHVLLARMECTLREIINTDGGEMTRMLHFENAATGAGLSGFIHVMFHDRRRIKVSTAPRFSYRSYIFRDVAGHDMVVHESLQESPFTFALPHQATRSAVEHLRAQRKGMMTTVAEVDAAMIRESSEHSLEEEAAKSQMMSFMQRQVKSLTGVIAAWERLHRLYYNYQGCYRGLRFKPSVEKSSRALSFVPINCHVQTLTVVHTGRSRSKPRPVLSLGSQMRMHSGVGLGGRGGLPVRPQIHSTASPGDMARLAAGAEGNSFVFEQTDFLTELSQAAVSQEANAGKADGEKDSNEQDGTPSSSPNSSPPHRPIQSSTSPTTPKPNLMRMLSRGGTPSSIGKSGEKEVKLSFTTSEQRSASGTAGQSGTFVDNLEKARLYRKVPPRSPHDHRYTVHTYVMTTCGAFSAHSAGFKSGGGGHAGALKLNTKLYEMLEKHEAEVSVVRLKGCADAGQETPPDSSPEAITGSPPRANPFSPSSSAYSSARIVHALLESGQRVLAQQMENQQRQHQIVSQAMTALATSFVTQLLSTLHDEAQWYRISRIGYLQQVESLLSTFHNEQYMLQDMAFAVRALEYVKFTCVQRVETEEEKRKRSIDERKKSQREEMRKTSQAMQNIAIETDRSSTYRARSSSGSAVTIPLPSAAQTQSSPATIAEMEETAGEVATEGILNDGDVTVAAASEVDAELDETDKNDTATLPPPELHTEGSSSSTISSAPSTTVTRSINTASPQLDAPSQTSSPPLSPRSPAVVPPLALATSCPNPPSLALSPSSAATNKPSLWRNASTPVQGVTKPSKTRSSLITGPSRRGGGLHAPPFEPQYLCAEDDVAASMTGVYPSIHQRLLDLHTVQVNLLMPTSAAPTADIPHVTEPVGSTAAVPIGCGVKKVKWFTMGGGASSNGDAAAMAAASILCNSASTPAIPLTSPSNLPRPYSSESIVIALEFPPHLYRLLPACLREMDSSINATSTASSLVKTTSFNYQAHSPTTPLVSPALSPIGEPVAPLPSTSPLPPSASPDQLGNTSTHTPGHSKTSSFPSSSSFLMLCVSADSEAPQLSTPLIDVYPVLITQGVNELQTMANKMSKNDLQADINTYSLEVIKAYYKQYATWQQSAENESSLPAAHAQASSSPLSSRPPITCMSAHLARISKDIQACELMIANFNAEKNIQLLVLCADIIKRMHGGRIICCKSAKDRTSMSVTWDQARILYEHHGLGEQDVQTVLNLMRMDGVRKLNVIKNTGASAYAFNVLQRSLLPACFRPPEAACSSSIDS